MIYEIDKETIDVLCKKKLTPTQYFICLLIYHKDVQGVLKYTNETDIVLGDEVFWRGKEEVRALDDLITRGFLLNTGVDTRDQYAIDNFIVTDKFTSGFLIGVEEVFKELWETYPKHLLIDNEEKPAKAVDYEETENKYLRAIQFSITKHKEVISKLKAYNKINKYASMNFRNFIGSRHWEDMEDHDNKQPKSRIR